MDSGLFSYFSLGLLSLSPEMLGLLLYECLALYEGSKELNSGSHASKPRTISIEPSPEIPCYFFKSRFK